MKVNFNVPFKNYKGQETKEIIADKVSEALYALGSESKVGNDRKYSAYKECKRINESPSEVEISTEEATLVKDVCAEFLVAGGYGQVCDLIEGKE